MDEYISREKVLKKLQMQLLYLEADQDKGEYSELCENRGARDALDNAIYDIRTIKAADVQPESQWISVKDRLPEKEQKVLVFYKAIGEKNRIHNDVIATNWRKSNGDFIPFRDYEITHWMPLPDPPVDGGNEDENG